MIRRSLLAALLATALAQPVLASPGAAPAPAPAATTLPCPRHWPRSRRGRHPISARDALRLAAPSLRRNWWSGWPIAARPLTGVRKGQDHHRRRGRNVRPATPILPPSDQATERQRRQLSGRGAAAKPPPKPARNAPDYPVNSRLPPPCNWRQHRVARRRAAAPIPAPLAPAEDQRRANWRSISCAHDSTIGRFQPDICH